MQDDNPAKTTVPISQPLGVLLALMGLVITIVLFVALRAWHHQTENVYFAVSIVGSNDDQIKARAAELDEQHRVGRCEQTCAVIRAYPMDSAGSWQTMRLRQPSIISPTISSRFTVHYG